MLIEKENISKELQFLFWHKIKKSKHFQWPTSIDVDFLKGLDFFFSNFLQHHFHCPNALKASDVHVLKYSHQKRYEAEAVTPLLWPCFNVGAPNEDPARDCVRHCCGCFHGAGLTGKYMDLNTRSRKCASSTIPFFSLLGLRIDRLIIYRERLLVIKLNLLHKTNGVVSPRWLYHVPLPTNADESSSTHATVSLLAYVRLDATQIEMYRKWMGESLKHTNLCLVPDLFQKYCWFCGVGIS